MWPELPLPEVSRYVDMSVSVCVHVHFADDVGLIVQWLECGCWLAVHVPVRATTALDDSSQPALREKSQTCNSIETPRKSILYAFSTSNQL